MRISSESTSVMSVSINPGATALTVIPRLASSRAERFRQTNQARLARGVVRLPGVADQSDDRADVDDAAAALLDHRAHQRLGEVEGAFQVRVQDRVPIVDRHAHAESIARHAGVVHQNVDASEVLQDLRARLLDRGMIGDIDRIGFRGIGATALISSAVFCAFASVRLTDATRAPSFARRTAMACPIPRPAPVTTATWFSNLMAA